MHLLADLGMAASANLQLAEFGMTHRQFLADVSQSMADGAFGVAGHGMHFNGELIAIVDSLPI